MSDQTQEFRYQNSEQLGNQTDKQPAKDQPQPEDEDSDEEYDKMNLQDLVPKVSNRDRLIEQNSRLKTQIYQLAKQMDQITHKPLKPQRQEEDSGLSSKKLQLKRLQIQLMTLKNKIFNVQHKIREYDVFSINRIQNKIKDVMLQIKQNQYESDSLKSVTHQQMIAVNNKSPEILEQKLASNKQTAREMREELKSINLKLGENQRVIRKNHEIIIDHHSRIKDMERKVMNKTQEQKSKRSKSSLEKVSSSQLNLLKEQVGELQRQRNAQNCHWHDKIWKVENEIYKKRNDQQKKAVIIREKEKELKLFELKLREVRRLIMSSDAKQEVDVSVLRYRRNIKYLQK